MPNKAIIRPNRIRLGARVPASLVSEAIARPDQAPAPTNMPASICVAADISPSGICNCRPRPWRCPRAGCNHQQQCAAGAGAQLVAAAQQQHADQPGAYSKPFAGTWPVTPQATENHRKAAARLPPPLPPAPMRHFVPPRLPHRCQQPASCCRSCRRCATGLLSDAARAQPQNRYMLPPAQETDPPPSSAAESRRRADTDRQMGRTPDQVGGETECNDTEETAWLNRCAGRSLYRRRWLHLRESRKTGASV